MGREQWSATVALEHLPLEKFGRNGLSIIPVALMPSDGGVIRLKNPKLIQEQLKQASALYQDISDVRQYGKGGIICKSNNLNCVSDLLRCTQFASLPVTPFIPAHLACVKGVVRGVDTSLSPVELLDLFSEVGATAVFRCTRLVEGTRVPTESVIVTFAGLSRPSEIKAWPLIYRVDQFRELPMQCKQCWRYGHVMRSCKSGQRCRNCGGSHSLEVCSAQDLCCCLCQNTHAADSSDCPVRVQELLVIETMGQRRCSRMEALNQVKQRPSGYANAVARERCLPDPTLSKEIEAAVDKAMSKFTDRFLAAFTAVADVLVAKVVSVLETAVPSLASSNIAPRSPVSDTMPLTRAPDTQPSPSPSLSAPSGESPMETAATPNKRCGSPTTSSRSQKKRENRRAQVLRDELLQAVTSILPT